VASPLDDGASPVEYVALWDTGATRSVIDKRVASQCGLLPVGIQRVAGVHGAADANSYLIRLTLPNNVVFPSLMATEGTLGDDIGILIGMDVISCGDFAVTNRDNRTVFTFRMPSIARYDYVKEHEASERRRLKKSRRNARKGR